MSEKIRKNLLMILNLGILFIESQRCKEQVSTMLMKQKESEGLLKTLQEKESDLLVRN